jgi:hypothetical protein
MPSTKLIIDLEKPSSLNPFNVGSSYWLKLIFDPWVMMAGLASKLDWSSFKTMAIKFLGLKHNISSLLISRKFNICSWQIKTYWIHTFLNAWILTFYQSNAFNGCHLLSIFTCLCIEQEIWKLLRFLY